MKKKNIKAQNKGIVLIKKSNNLIESRFKFDIWETRFFLSVLGQIKREDEEFKVYRVWYRDVIKTFGVRSHQSYDFLREAAKKLMRKTLTIDTKDGDFARKKIYHIIRMVDFLADGQEGKRGVESQEYVDVTIEDELKPHLLQLQRSFTAYDIKNITKLGAYPIRVYELLKQYESIGNRSLGFEEMKMMFELEHEYPRFANFYQKIIQPAVREINANTDLNITKVDKVKEGRRVVGLHFIFRKKVEDTTARENPQFVYVDGFENMAQTVDYEEITDDGAPTEGDRLFALFYTKVVENLGITPMVFSELVRQYSEEQMQQAIRVTHRAKIDGQIKSNISGFFIQALRKGFTDKKEEQLKKQTKETKAQKMKKLEMAVQKCAEDRDFEVREQIRILVSENPEITNTAILEVQRDNRFKTLIQELEIISNRKLDVDDFRQNPDLRNAVMNQIIESNKSFFENIYQKFEQEVAQIEQKWQTS
jgi:plasmid replication initiation protein